MRAQAHHNEKHYATSFRFQGYSRKVLLPFQTLAPFLSVLGTNRRYLHWLQGLTFSPPLYVWCGCMFRCFCLSKNPSGFIFLFVRDFLGVSASSEFREGCAKARGNVGKTTWARGWEDICHVLRPRWVFPQGTGKVFPLISHTYFLMCFWFWIKAKVWSN